jgi:hypothetical protein
MLEATFVINGRQLARIKVTQSFNVVITTIGVETIVAPNTHVTRRGRIIGSIINLSRGLGEFFTRRNLNRSLGLLAENIGVVGTPRMVFTNLITTIHVHKTIDRPPMAQ